MLNQARFSPYSAICGLVVGLGLGGAFWAGHQFWPQHSAVPPTQAGLTAPPSHIVQGAGGTNFVADIIAEAIPSVVNIDTSRSISIPRFAFPQYGPDFGFGDLFGEGFGVPVPLRQKFESRGAGSGVIIQADGYILTNNHVIQNADNIKVTLSDGRSFTGKVIGKDKFTDLALVKIPATGLKAAKLGVSKNLRPGDWAVAIGSPLGFSHSATLGIVSALGRPLRDINLGGDLIQTDAAINPGNSGGPLLNIKGEVIGINQAVSRNGQNISFAIPIDVAKPVADQLLASGSIHHPYVGISMMEMDERVAGALHVSPGTKGVAIRIVQPGSPAERAGLLPGDVIQKVDSKEVNSPKEVQLIVREHKPGDKLAMSVLRQQMPVVIPLKIGEFDEAKDTKQLKERRPQSIRERGLPDAPDQDEEDGEQDPSER